MICARVCACVYVLVFPTVQFYCAVHILECTKCFFIVSDVQCNLHQIQNCAGKAPTYHHVHQYTVFGTATFQSNILHTLLLSIPVETPKVTDSTQNRSSIGTAQYCILGSICVLQTVTAAVSSVEATVIVVGAGAGEGGTRFIPGQSAGLVCCGKAEGAGTLHLVL